MNSTLSSLIELLGWVLLHFLWQGAAIALLLGLFLRFSKRSSSQMRYAAAGAAMLLMLGSVAGTLVWQLSQTPSTSAIPVSVRGNVSVSPASPIPDSSNASANTVPSMTPEVSMSSPRQETATVIRPRMEAATAGPLTAIERLRPWLPWIVALWAGGVAFFSLRLLNGWRMVRKWRVSGSDSIPDDWPHRFTQLCHRLGINRTVRLLSSATLAVPVVIGWLKPVVLVPAGLFAGLSTAQLEALLSHELAHVRRHDYPVNLLQNILETLFFYHPAVWWVSAQLRSEREHCCDDVASSHSGGVLDYARALTALEEMRGPSPALGMSAAGGSLLQRVRRLAGVSEERAFGIAWPLGLLTLGAAALTLPFTLLSAAEAPFDPPQAAHTAVDSGGAYCVHDGKQTHFILVSHNPFTSSTSSGANPKSRTWHDDGTLTFEDGTELTFSRRSNKPDTLNLISRGRDGTLSTTAHDLTKGRVFIITPTVPPDQLPHTSAAEKHLRESGPVTTGESLRTFLLFPRIESALVSAQSYSIRGLLLPGNTGKADDAGLLPDLYEPDPDQPGSWRRKYSVFEMPLYGSEPEAWLKYPANSSSFYISIKGQVWAIPGDPVEKLKLHELLSQELAKDSPVDALLRISKMILRGDDRLRASAYSLMQELKQPKWRFDYDEVIKHAGEFLKTNPSAPSSPAGIAALAHVSALSDAAKAEWEKSRVKLPDDAYQPGINIGDRTDIIWSEPDSSGMSIGYTKPAQGTEWKIGEEMDFTVWIRNDSKAPVKFSHTPRVDEGLRMWATDDNGQRQEVQIIMNTVLITPSRTRLEPGQMLEWKKTAVHLVEANADGSPPSRDNDYRTRLAVKAGTWQFQIEGRIGAFEMRTGSGAGDVTSPAAGEWTGTLLARPLKVQVAGKETALLPAAKTLNPAKVRIGKDRIVSLNGETVDETALKAKLAAIAKEDQNRSFVLHAEKEVEHSKVIRVLELLRNAGFTQIGLAPADEAPAAKPKVEADPFAMPSDPEKRAEARRKGISVNVLDSSGKKPIPEFRVIAGVKSSVSGGKDIANWQPHTLHTGYDGGLIWPLNKAYDTMALRVEADGYEPQVYAWLEKSKGPQDLYFQLAEAKGINGVAVLPDGKPAARAIVALAMVQRDAVIEGGKLRHAGAALPEKPSDQWRLPRIVKADGSGKFQLPSEYDPTAAMLIIHESGVREISVADFKKNPDGTAGDGEGWPLLKLQPWGRIEGKVLWGTQPGADQRVSLSIHRDTYGYPGVIAQYEKTKANADGSFVFEKVLPGLTQLSCPIPTGSSKSGISEVNLTGQLTHLTVQPGVNPALIGGAGRTVRGKLTGRDSWDGVTFHFHPDAPHIGFPGDDDMWKAWSEFQKSPSGPLFFRSGLKVNADGTFEIPGVLPGHYQIFFSREGESQHVASSSFTVEPEVPGQKTEAQGLFPGKVIPDIQAKPGTPAAPPKSPDKGKTGKLSPGLTPVENETLIREFLKIQPESPAGNLLEPRYKPRVPVEEGVPVLKDIPFIDRLFRFEPRNKTR